jgi:hypothetical protein
MRWTQVLGNVVKATTKHGTTAVMMTAAGAVKGVALAAKGATHVGNAAVEAGSVVCESVKEGYKEAKADNQSDNQADQDS